MTARLLLALALAAFMLPLHAQQPSAQAAGVDAQAVAAERVWRNYQQRIAVAMAETGQPRDLALAAVLQDMANIDAEGRIPDDATTAAWRASAGAGAGADVIANSMLMMGAEAGALREQAARRWAQAEPDNIAPLLLLEDGGEQVLDAARDLRRFDLHMYDQVRWIQSALLRHPPSAAERAVLFDDDGSTIEEYAAISAMALWAAVAIPSLQPLNQACEQGALRSNPARAADCAHIARTLAGYSDSTLGWMLGIGMLESMAGNASERAEAQALRRRMDWQMIEWGRIATGQPRDGAPQFVRLLADPQVRTEQDLVQRILAEAGVPLDPPAGWQPPRR